MHNKVRCHIGCAFSVFMINNIMTSRLLSYKVHITLNRNYIVFLIQFFICILLCYACNIIFRLFCGVPTIKPPNIFCGVIALTDGIYIIFTLIRHSQLAVSILRDSIRTKICDYKDFINCCANVDYIAFCACVCTIRAEGCRPCA